jgi:hypothetical protein
MTDGVQSKVLDLFYQESLSSEYVVPEEFLDHYKSFPHYTPLEIAIQCQSGCQITKILLENGAQVDYVNPVSNKSAILQAVQMYAEYITKTGYIRVLKPEQRLLPEKYHWHHAHFDENGHRPTETIALLLKYRASLPPDEENHGLPEDFLAMETSHPEEFDRVNSMIAEEITRKIVDSDSYEIDEKFEVIKEIFMNSAL